MPESNKDTAVIKVGFISGFNSPYRTIVKNQYMGTQLAVDQINTAGGILGKHVELIPRDDRMDRERATVVTSELINAKVDILLGTLSVDTLMEVNRQAKAAGIALMALCQSESITSAPEIGPYTFHECLTPYITAQLLGRWIFTNIGKRIVFVIADYGWGHGMYDSFQVFMRQNGGVDLGVIRIPLGASEQDFEQHFDDILKLKPDVISVTNMGADQINFIRAAHRTGLKREAVIVHSISDIHVTDELTLDEMVGMFWGTSFYWGLEDHNESARTFVKSFRTMFPDDYPSAYAACAYSGTLELLYAANQAGEYPLNYREMTQILEGRTYDHYKGAQWWRPCDHQSFQDFYILRFKGPEESAHKHDIAEIIGTVPWDFNIERSCEDLGVDHLASGHFKPLEPPPLPKNLQVD